MGILVRPSTRHGFRLVEELWTPKRHCKTIPREGYSALGFNPGMTIDQARLRAKQINQQEQLRQKAVTTATRIVAHHKAVQSAYLPDYLTQPFETELNELYRDNDDRLETVLKHWFTAKKLIAKLELDPKDFFNERTKILNYYKDQEWSPDYIKRITRALNLWGSFYSRRTNSFFQPIPKLSNIQTQKIIERRDNLDDVRKAAPPLQWADLRNKKATFENEGLTLQWNWLYIGLWFGLRPLEVDNLMNPKNIEVVHSEEYGIDILRVFQTKLTSLPKDKRWKFIPVLFEEQKQALKLISEKAFKRPLNKTLQRIFDKPIETYSPRKGFTDLMLEKEYSLEDISVFLGHCDINTTWRHYKDKHKFKMPTPKAS